MLNFKTLISDDGRNVSIGRTLTWLFTFAILYMYIKSGNDVPSNIVFIYVSLLSYNLFKKPLPILEKYVEQKSKGVSNVDNNK